MYLTLNEKCFEVTLEVSCMIMRDKNAFYLTQTSNFRLRLQRYSCTWSSFTASLRAVTTRNQKPKCIHFLRIHESAKFSKLSRIDILCEKICIMLCQEMRLTMKSLGTVWVPWSSFNLVIEKVSQLEKKWNVLLLQ